MKERLEALIREESRDAKSRSDPGVHHVLERSCLPTVSINRDALQSPNPILPL